MFRATGSSRVRGLLALWIAGAALAWGGESARGNPPGIANVAPFSGDYSESFSGFFLGGAHQLTVFSDQGVLRGDDAGASVFVTTSSNFGGDNVNARSGTMAGQFGIVDWDFPQPATQFGGYWENNSGASDATVEFFGESNNSLGTVIASVPVHGQEWVWNGWSFDTPVARIRVVGNGIENGLIWYDDMELNTVPEPACAGAIALCGSLILRRRRGASR